LGNGNPSVLQTSVKGFWIGRSEEAGAFDLYEEEEKRIEALRPYRSYRTVLSEAASAVVGRFGRNIPD
jgi:hypothetical protein